MYSITYFSMVSHYTIMLVLECIKVSYIGAVVTNVTNIILVQIFLHFIWYEWAIVGIVNGPIPIYVDVARVSRTVSVCIRLLWVTMSEAIVARIAQAIVICILLLVWSSVTIGVDGVGIVYHWTVILWVGNGRGLILIIKHCALKK